MISKLLETPERDAYLAHRSDAYLAHSKKILYTYTSCYTENIILGNHYVDKSNESVYCCWNKT